VLCHRAIPRDQQCLLTHRQQLGDIDLADANQVIWRDWPTSKGYVSRDDGMVACRVYSRARARGLRDMIMTSTYDFAEPGDRKSVG
jgi:ribonucleoside-diphosphate reductase alpha chain